MTDFEKLAAQASTSKIVDKVRKLLAKASGTNNDKEAAIFAEKAHALLAEHNLSLGDIEEQVRSEGFATEHLRTDSRPWRRQMAHQAAKLYFCEYFFTHDYEQTGRRKNGYTRTDVHTFIGLKHNLAVAQMMFDYLNSTIERLSIEASLAVPVKGRTSFQTSFRHACATRVAYRLAERRFEAKKGGTVKNEATGKNLPALLSMYEQAEKSLKEHLENKHPDVKPKKERKQIKSSAGQAAGDKAGQKISLDGQIGNDKPVALIGA